MDTNRRFRTTLSDGSTLIVCRVERDATAISSGPEGWRRSYGVRLRTRYGMLNHYGMGGPAGLWSNRTAPTAREMAATAVSFMLAAAEHYARYGPCDCPSDPWFMDDLICYMVSSELESLALDLEPAS